VRFSSVFPSSTSKTAVYVSLQCSADCGEGSRSRSVVCMMSQTNSLPLDNCDDEDKAEELMPCDLGPCSQRLEWYTGPWGQVHGHTHAESLVEALKLLKLQLK